MESSCSLNNWNSSLVLPGGRYSAAAKNIFFKWVQPAVRHRLTYIKMFVLASSFRKPMLTSWHFGAGGDILGQKYAF